MNNAFINQEEIDSSTLSREKVETLTETIEALQQIANSSYWKVLKQNVFDVDLAKAKRSLVNSKDTTEMFRLQGEIRWGEKLSLENLIFKYRNELSALKQQINE
jgi:hypothetical protein